MKQSFQILTEKMLDRYLDVSSTRQRTKSGMRPDAQTIRLCQAPESQGLAGSIPMTTIEKMKRENIRLYYLYEFMIATACRITEALNLTNSDVTMTGHVRLKGSKGSKDRTIHGGMASTYLIKRSINRQQLWQDWNRFYVYREFKKYGISQIIGLNKKASVTHLPRHIVSSQIKKAGMSQKESIQALGHKTTKANDYYFK